MSKLLPSRRIGEVDLDGGEAHRQQRVSNGNAGVGVSTRIDDDPRYQRSRRLNCVDQAALGVGLGSGDRDLKLGAPISDQAVDLGEGCGSVDLRLPGAEQVEIGPVQYQNLHNDIPATPVGVF